MSNSFPRHDPHALDRHLLGNIAAGGCRRSASGSVCGGLDLRDLFVADVHSRSRSFAASSSVWASFTRSIAVRSSFTASPDLTSAGCSKLLLCRHQFGLNIRPVVSLPYGRPTYRRGASRSIPQSCVGGRQILLIELDASDRTDYPVHRLERGIYGPDADQLRLSVGTSTVGPPPPAWPLLGSLLLPPEPERSMLCRRGFALRCPLKGRSPLLRFSIQRGTDMRGRRQRRATDDNDGDVSCFHFASAP